MSQIHATPSDWLPDEEKPILYHVWALRDRKWQSLFCAAILVLVVLWVVQFTAWIAFGVLAACCLLASAWTILLPVHIEVNSEGIVRTLLGHKRFIAWTDIRSYQECRHGMLLLPRKTRFRLEAFRAYYLPIPPSMIPEVRYRFRVYVDRSPFE